MASPLGPPAALSSANIRALNSQQPAGAGNVSAASLPGVIPSVPAHITAILGPNTVKAGLVYYGVAERETTSVVKSRKKILISGTRTAIIFVDMDSGEVLRMFRYGEILSPFTVACASADPSITGVASMLIKVGNEHDALLHFDSKYAKLNDKTWSSPDRLVQVIRNYHDFYVKAPLEVLPQSQETKLRRAASLKSPSKDTNRLAGIKKKMDNSPRTLPPKVQGSEALPGAPSPVEDAEPGKSEPGKSVSFPTFAEESLPAEIATENFPDGHHQSLSHDQQAGQSQSDIQGGTQQASTPKATPKATPLATPMEKSESTTALTSGSDGASADLVKQLQMEVANLKSERDAYQNENSRLQYELEEMQYDNIGPGDIDAVAKVMAAGQQPAAPSPFGDFETTLVTSDHTVDDFNRLAQQVLQLQKQLLDERADRQNLIKEEVLKMEQSYDVVVLNQQDEIRALSDQLRDMEVVFQRLRSGIDGGNTQAMLHSFHAGATTFNPNLPNRNASGGALGANPQRLDATQSPGFKLSVRSLQADGTLGSIPLGMPQGYSTATRPAVGTVEDVGTVPTPRYNYVYPSVSSSAFSADRVRKAGSSASALGAGGTDLKSLSLQPDLAPGSRAVRNRLKLDI